MTPQKLRESILNSAFAGKYSQNSFLATDDTADSFFHLLLSKKELLMREKIIRREKNPLSSKDFPFEIPDNWLWVRTGDCVSNRTGLSYDKTNLSKKSESMIRVLRGGNISDMKYRFLDNDVMISSEYVDPALVLMENDIITPAVTSLENIAKMARIEKDYADVVVGGFVLVLRPFLSDCIFSKFLLYLFSSPYFRQECRKITKKSGQAFYNLSREKMMNIMIPLPPANEQKRIVEKIESLMPLVDEYELVWNRLDRLNKSISSELTRSLLKAAAEGKLPYSSAGNSQDNNYLQLVRDDSLAFEKTLGKKASPILPIEESEIPFDIPDNWSWMRLSQLVSKRIKRGKSPKYIKSSGVLVFAQKCNTKKGYIDLSLSQFLDESQLSKYDESEYMEDGDIVINSTGGGTLGRVGIYHTTDNPLKMPIVPDSHVTVIRVNPRVNNKFVYYVLRYYQPYLETLGDGSTNQTELNPMTIAKLLIPLPPRMEQDSIVAVLEAVLPLCRDLEANSIHE